MKMYLPAWSLGVLLVTACVGTAAEPGREPAGTNRFALRLTDGSSLVCQPELDAIPFKTSFAEVQIPLARIESLKLDAKSRAATLLLLNGDKLQGECPLTELAVASALGDLKIALVHITELATTVPKAPVISDSPAKRSQCVNNLRLIDHAKQQVATASQTMADSDVPGWDQITPYFKGGGRPTCPAGGTYTIHALNANPACSVPGHQLGQDMR